MDAMVKPWHDRFITKRVPWGGFMFADLSSLLKRSGRQGTSNHRNFGFISVSGPNGYWVPVLPLARQTGMTTRELPVVRDGPSVQVAISSFHALAPRLRISLVLVRGDGYKLKS